MRSPSSDGHSDEEQTQTLPSHTDAGTPEHGVERLVPVLVLVWSRDEPERLGELVAPPVGAPEVEFSIGRAQDPEAGMIPLSFCRLRPRSREDTGPLRSSHISRRQLGVRVIDDRTLDVERLASAPLRVNNIVTDRAQVRAGDLIEVERRFSLLCARRPQRWSQRPGPTLGFPFGAADSNGLVGESTAIWALRASIEQLARSEEHVVVHGPSGTGKELIAQALHRGSLRASAPLVARNAATFPEQLVDAELFGNMKNFPNPGMRERKGLFGEADGSTLFLDEIGELPLVLQPHLLRVLDDGEYHRLGETRARTVDVRLVGATNRALTSLRHDLIARFALRIETASLQERRDDIPLLAVHLLRDIVERDGFVAERFFADGRPRMSAGLIRTLVRHDYTSNVRELRQMLWRSIRHSQGSTLAAVDDGETGPAAGPKPELEGELVDPATLTREQIVEALERCEGVRERAWRELGLRSRHQLKRLLQKFDLVGR